MFQKWGKQFVEGAKAEVTNPETVNKVLDILLKIGVVAMFVLAGRSERNKSQTIIINNYISDRK